MEYLVRKVANGWVVEDAVGYVHGDRRNMDNFYVFNTWAQCSKWLETQFEKYQGKRK